MGRAKVPIKLIEDPKSRNATFIKRRKGLKKKAMEFGTLCGVDVCMICFGPQDDRQYEPEIFPNDSNEVCRIIKRYQDLPREEQDRRKLNLVSFLQAKNIKLEDELKQRKRETFSILDPSCDNQWNDLPIESLQQLMYTLDEKLKTVNMKIGSMKGKEFSNQISGHPNHIEDNIIMNGPCYPMLTQSIFQPISYMNPSFDQRQLIMEVSQRPSYGNFNANNAFFTPPTMNGSIGNPGMAIENYDDCCSSSHSDTFPCHHNEFYGDIKQFQFPIMGSYCPLNPALPLQTCPPHQTYQSTFVELNDRNRWM